MAVNCNRVSSNLQAFDPSIPFTDDIIETKSSLGRTASIAIHAARSNCYKALETLEMSPTVNGSEVVYLRAATSKLNTAAKAIRGMRDILARGKTTDEFRAWLETLDYDRLYKVGTEKNLIPTGIEQWKRLVELMKSPNDLAATESLITDLEKLQKEIDLIVNTLISNTSDSSLTAKQVEHILIIQTTLIQFSIFAQMVAYLNAVEPMDKTWCHNIDTPELAKTR